MKTHLYIQLKVFPLTKPRKFVAAKEKQHNYLHHRKRKQTIPSIIHQQKTVSILLVANRKLQKSQDAL